MPLLVSTPIPYAIGIGGAVAGIYQGIKNGLKGKKGHNTFHEYGYATLTGLVGGGIVGALGIGGIETYAAAAGFSLTAEAVGYSLLGGAIAGGIFGLGLALVAATAYTIPRYLSQYITKGIKDYNTPNNQTVITNT